MKFPIFPLLLSLLLFSCDDVDRSEIIVDGTEEAGSDKFVRKVQQEDVDELEEIANGVYIRKPDQFRKARSFDGYQYVNGPATISLEIREQEIGGIKRMFTDKALSARKEKLLEYHPVNFYGNETAFMTVTESKRKNIYKFLLAVEEEGRTYNVKALCSIGLGEHLNMYDLLKRTLLTTELRGYQAEATDFVAVDGGSPVSEMYTRDGAYPTASPDGAFIQRTLAVIPDSKDRIAVHKQIAEELKELTGEDKSAFSTVPLSNGVIVHATAQNDSVHAFVALVYAEGERMAQQYTGTANSAEAIANIEKFVLDKSTKRQVIVQ